MNKLLCHIIFAFGSIAIAEAQCNEYYVLQEGSEWEYEMYNAKEKLTGRSQQKVASFSTTSGGYVATVNSAMFDEKGKEAMKGDLEFKCDNGIMYIDMRNFISEEQLKAFSNYEMKVEATNLEIPKTLSPGQALPDGTVTITGTGAPFPMRLTITITDRKVEARESVTTPAGSFDCFKVTSKMTIENQMGMKVTAQFPTVEWIAPKVGTVKSESYNKSGKLRGYTVLSKREN